MNEPQINVEKPQEAVALPRPCSAFEADDRGNVVDFYYEDGDSAGTLDREYEADGSAYYFEGSDELKEWAILNGYAEGIRFAFETGNKPNAPMKTDSPLPNESHATDSRVSGAAHGSTLWAVMKAHAWDSITTAHGIPLMCPPEGPHRFIPVFNTREQAVAWAGTDEHVAMMMPNDPISATAGLKRHD